jgi:hypothetical protein
VTQVPADIPAEIGLLPDAIVTKYLTRGIRSGDESPPLVALSKAAIPVTGAEPRWQPGPVRELLDEAMRRFEANRTAADGWLAPRLHATLRMSRGEASDTRRWNYIAMLIGSDYVVWRHRGSDAAVSGRFSGPHYTQAFSRLWWAAEMFRNGADYRPVEIACRVQDMLNTVLRLDVIDHRPTVLAIIRLLGKLTDAGVSRLGDHVNALSSAVNTAGSTLMFDVLAQEGRSEREALQNWIGDVGNMPPVAWNRLPYGPDDGEVADEALEPLVALFEQLLAEAPIRKRPKHAAEEKHADS